MWCVHKGGSSQLSSATQHIYKYMYILEKKETDTENLLGAPNQGRNPGDEVYDGFRVPPFFALACRADFCHTLSTSIQKDKVEQHKTA